MHWTPLHICYTELTQGIDGEPGGHSQESCWKFCDFLASERVSFKQDGVPLQSQAGTRGLPESFVRQGVVVPLLPPTPKGTQDLAEFRWCYM